jgi:hypothetical protein
LQFYDAATTPPKGTMLTMAFGATMWIGVGVLAALALGRASRIGACPLDRCSCQLTCPPPR